MVSRSTYTNSFWSDEDTVWRLLAANLTVVSKWRQATVLSYPKVSRLLRCFEILPLIKFLQRRPLGETGFEDLLDYQSWTHGIYLEPTRADLEPTRADHPLAEFQWPATA
jgi:hypothetical protein